MKLRNPTARLINIPISNGNLQLKPNSFINCNAQMRREVERFVKVFGLTWELDDEDLPAGVDASKYKGSHAYAQLHPEDDTKFDANAVRHQSDAEEIADVWDPVIAQQREQQAADDDPLEDLLIIKETVENETPLEISEDTKAALAAGADLPQEAEDILAREDWFQRRNAESWEKVPPEGPDYLRAETPDGVELDIGLDLDGAAQKMANEAMEQLDAVIAEKKAEAEEAQGKSNYQKIEYEMAPPNCPYTKSELQLGVKARLWEICDGLGLNGDGSKADLINRIFHYYDHN